MRKTSGVPRRANKVAQLAAEVAARNTVRVLARQHVSDKIGYAVAVTIGAIAGFCAWWAGLLVVGYYTAMAIRAYRAFRRSPFPKP